MRRYQPGTEEGHIHDLVIVGGGIYGASMAYTAALNGIDTLLVERDDFARHASANSQKVIHGGIRYLQSLDLRRVVESIREKHRFYKLFPHQVQPLPCVFPTSGYGGQGNEAFRIAFFLYSLLERWWGRSCRQQKLTPEILAKAEVVRRFPHLQQRGIRGGALWYDGICLRPERVILSLLKSAVQHGGKVANYMEMTAFARQQDGLFQVTLYDAVAETKYQVYTRKIALCTGAWFKDRLGDDKLPAELENLSLIRGMNLIVPALFSSATSLATKVKDALTSRFLFVVPWQGYSIEGTYWEDCDAPDSRWHQHQQRADEFHSLHQRALDRGDDKVPVLASHIGCVPGGKEAGKDASKRVLSHYRLVDREAAGRGDILQVVGVKFTTAFDVVFKALMRLYPKRELRDTLLFPELPCGSDAGDRGGLADELRKKYKNRVSRQQYDTLFQLFGVELDKVIAEYIESLSDGESLCSEENFYRGLVRYCVGQEMTLHLADLVWRRLFPDYPEPLPAGVVTVLAEEMAAQLGWTKEQQKEEMQIVQQGRVFV